MCKLCQLYSVFLAEEGFVMAAFLDIVDLNSLVALGCHTQVASIVKVDGQNMGLWSAFLNVVASEELDWR